MEPVICFEMLFPHFELPEKISRIAATGFRAVEFWDWRDKDISGLRDTCSRHGIRIANFSGHRRGDLIAPATWDRFFADLKDAVGIARFLGCSTLMLLSNELGEGGQVIKTYPEMSSVEKRGNLAKGLAKALEQTPEDLELVLEPLNTRIDHSGYYLSNMETAVSLIQEINDPRLKVLCDLYHLGTMEEDLETVIGKYIDKIGYFHVADIPGRHEPGSGTADWRLLLRQIARNGYKGPVGFEYSPENDSMESLHKIRALWDEVFP
jgi:hydroxypyruvate isomerase